MRAATILATRTRSRCACSRNQTSLLNAAPCDFTLHPSLFGLKKDFFDFDKVLLDDKFLYISSDIRTLKHHSDGVAIIRFSLNDLDNGDCKVDSTFWRVRGQDSLAPVEHAGSTMFFASHVHDVVQGDQLRVYKIPDSSTKLTHVDRNITNYAANDRGKVRARRTATIRASASTTTKPSASARVSRSAGYGPRRRTTTSRSRRCAWQCFGPRTRSSSKRTRSGTRSTPGPIRPWASTTGAISASSSTRWVAVTTPRRLPSSGRSRPTGRDHAPPARQGHRDIQDEHVGATTPPFIATTAAATRSSRPPGRCRRAPAQPSRRTARRGSAIRTRGAPTSSSRSACPTDAAAQGGHPLDRRGDEESRRHGAGDEYALLRPEGRGEVERRLLLTGQPPCRSALAGGEVGTGNTPASVIIPKMSAGTYRLLARANDKRPSDKTTRANNCVCRR